MTSRAVTSESWESCQRSTPSTIGLKLCCISSTPTDRAFCGEKCLLCLASTGEKSPEKARFSNEDPVLCAADAYEELKSLAAGIRWCDQNLLHIIRAPPSGLFGEAHRTVETLKR